MSSRRNTKSGWPTISNKTARNNLKTQRDSSSNTWTAPSKIPAQTMILDNSNASEMTTGQTKFYNHVNLARVTPCLIRMFHTCTRLYPSAFSFSEQLIILIELILLNRFPTEYPINPKIILGRRVNILFFLWKSHFIGYQIILG